jgi:hypothetical protein
LVGQGLEAPRVHPAEAGIKRQLRPAQHDGVVTGYAKRSPA